MKNIIRWLVRDWGVIIGLNDAHSNIRSNEERSGELLIAAAANVDVSSTWPKWIPTKILRWIPLLNSILNRLLDNNPFGVDYQ